MLQPHRLLMDGQRNFAEGFRLRVASLTVIEQSQVLEATGGLGMSRSQCLLVRLAVLRRPSVEEEQLGRLTPGNGNLPLLFAAYPSS